MSDNHRPRRIFWPRELRSAQADPGTYIRQALTFQSECQLCGTPLGQADLSCLVATSSRLPMTFAIETIRPPIGIAIRLAHAACSPPFLAVNPAIETTPPAEVSNHWRLMTLYSDDGAAAPGMIVQVSYTETEYAGPNDARNALIRDLLRHGLTPVNLGPANSRPVGSGRIDDRWMLDARIAGIDYLRDIDLSTEPEHREWALSAVEGGAFLLMTGIGLYLPTEGEVDLDTAIDRGDVVWGWIDIDSAHEAR